MSISLSVTRVDLLAAVGAAAAVVAASYAHAALGRRALARWPEPLRTREEVKRHYGRILDPTPWLREIATSWWSLFYVVFFGLLAAAQFGEDFIILLAFIVGSIYSLSGRPELKRQEKEFVARLTGAPPRGPSIRLAMSWVILSDVRQAGRLMTCAFLGVAISRLLGLR